MGRGVGVGGGNNYQSLSGFDCSTCISLSKMYKCILKYGLCAVV